MEMTLRSRIAVLVVTALMSVTGASVASAAMAIDAQAQNVNIGAAAAAVQSSGEDDPPLTVMTQNVYQGVDAELAQAGAATTFPVFLNATSAIYNGYHERKFPERAAGLAAEIKETQPDAIGLQEVVMVRTDPKNDGSATPAETVDLDYLQILLGKLAAQGLHYKPVVASTNWDIEVPTALGFDLRHTDRVVILIRTNGQSGLQVLGTKSGHFRQNCQLPTAAVGQIKVLRGWASADVSVRGKTVRIINTHLDGDCSDPAIQLAQAREILQGPVQEARENNLPVILLGDLNSKADGTGTPTYSELLKPAVGFVDAWAEAGSGSGFTCCQTDHLVNTESVLSDRRDFVLFRHGPFKAMDAEVVGANPADRTPSGLWPSDHAGVVAQLHLPPEDSAANAD